MARKPFSARFANFLTWRRARGRQLTVYDKHIIRKHDLASDATLKDLVKTSVRDLDLSLRVWKDLTPSERVERRQVLEIIRRMREGESFSEAVRDVGLNSKIVRKHVGRTLFKKRGRFVAKENDAIEQRMNINEKGKVVSIVVTNSRDRSIIGEYHSAVRKALASGDSSELEKFGDITIMDDAGKKHTLETDLDTLFDIEDKKEDPEEFEIYDDRQ